MAAYGPSNEGRESFTREQIVAQDFVDGQCYDLLRLLSHGKADIQWDIALIGKVRDAVQEVLVDDLHLMSDMEFYPYLDESWKEIRPLGPLKDTRTKKQKAADAGC